MQDLTGMVRKTENYYFAFGGLSDVWRGEWTTDTEHSNKASVLAIKVIRSISNDPIYLDKLKAKLMREARVWSTLNHPNITPFFGVAFDLARPSMPSLICPYYSNGDLPAYLMRHPNADRLLLVSQVAAGLVYLHRLDPPIIHGDMKGTNILINDEGEASITDFGFSRILGTPGFTTKGAAGTCRWMAPELVDDDDNHAEKLTVNAATDIWAFAMTVTEIITGRVPFHHLRTDSAVIHAISKHKRPSREQYAEITDDVWTVLEFCWNDEPTSRPSMTSLALFFDILYTLLSSHRGQRLTDTDIALILSANAATARIAGSPTGAVVPHVQSSGCSVLGIIDRWRRSGGNADRARRWLLFPTSQEKAPANHPILPYRCNWQECFENFDTLSECQIHELSHRRWDLSGKPTVERLEYVSMLSIVAITILSWFLPLCCKRL